MPWYKLVFVSLVEMQVNIQRTEKIYGSYSSQQEPLQQAQNSIRTL